MTTLVPDAVVAAFKSDIDVTLLRQNLRRTPTERLLAIISMMDVVEELRRAAARRLEKASAKQPSLK